ncbi:MAG: thiamine pyrophosphate-requiring protein [Alphaproteobacteria bacterium]
MHQAPAPGDPMKAIEAIARILKAEGTEMLFCYPRQELIEHAAIAGIRPVVCRQERVGIAMADGLGRASFGEKIGVFTMQAGPGVENSFPGVAQSFSDSVPTLIIAGGDSRSRRHVHQAFSSLDNFSRVSRFLAAPATGTDVPALLRQAYFTLRSAGGPAILEMPREAWNEEVPDALVNSWVRVRPALAMPDPDAVTAAAKHLVAAKAPILWGGQGVITSGASEALVRLAELLDAPVMTTLSGKSGFPEDHPLSVGASAVNGTRMQRTFLGEADVVAGFGTSFTRTAFGPRVPDADRIIIHQTRALADMHKESAPAVTLLGDTRLALEALADEVERQGGRKKSDTADRIAAIRTQWLADWRAQHESDEVPINQYRVLHELARLVDPADVIITHDAGSPREQVAPFWRATRPGGYLGWGKSTQLGYGLGLIMGAKLAQPSKLCINVMGDAAIGMTGLDLETAARNGIATLTIVFNNGVMAMEGDSMPYAIKTYGAWDEGGNYARVAEGLGVWSRRTDRPEAIADALRAAIAETEAGRPAVAEFVVKEGYDFSK